MGGKYTAGHFIIWIYTDKIPPDIRDEDVKDILRKNYFYSEHKEAPLSDFVTMRKAKFIASLSEVRFRYGDDSNYIEAWLVNNMEIIGIRDVLPALDVLIEIENRL